MNHLEAKGLVDSLGLTPRESQAIRFVSWHETNYGQGWDERGAGSNNMGAITGKGDAGSFTYNDSRYDPATDSVIQYTTEFRKESTPQEGFRVLARTVLKPNVKESLVRDGTLEGLAAAMRDNSYFIGVKPYAQSILDYANALAGARNVILSKTGEPDLFTGPESVPSKGSVIPGLAIIAFAGWLFTKTLSVKGKSR